jgi:hypothetical protein
MTGIISPSDVRSATSNYQDSATDPFGEESEEAAVLREDELEDNNSSSVGSHVNMNINMNAICKVRIPSYGCPYSVVTFVFIQLRKIIRAVRSSPQRRQAWFRSVHLTKPESMSAAKGDGNPLMLILDCRTRWSSTHQMLGKPPTPSILSLLMLLTRTSPEIRSCGRSLHRNAQGHMSVCPTCRGLGQYQACKGLALPLS